MAFGNDQSVFVEDKLGDLGAPGSSPFWLSPDVDIPAHSGRAVQGANTVQIRVHAHEEPFIEEKVVAEVYVGNPSLAMSPTVGTVRIDPGNLLFRPPGVAGSEPILTEAGVTLTFPWTPSSGATDVDGPGHRCLVVRAFPQSVTPPTGSFTVPTEQHEAQHNIDVLSTTTAPGQGFAGDGTPDDPRRRDENDGRWAEIFDTIGHGKRGKRFVVWAVDPTPDDRILHAVRRNLGRRKFAGFSDLPLESVSVDAVGLFGDPISPKALLRTPFGRKAGLGRGLFARDRLVAALSVVLGPRKLSQVVLRFDHSNLKARTGVVLHGAQFDENGVQEGGVTLVAVSPN